MARSTVEQPSRTVPTGPLEIRVLGPLHTTLDGEQLRLGGPKPETVFALLVAAAGRSVPADALIDELWGEEPPASARATLQSHVSKLRRALGEAVVWERGAYRLAVDRDRVDAWRFEDEVAAARRDIATDPTGAARRLGDALALWRGHAFAGLAVCPALEAEARRLEELRLQAVEDRMEAVLAFGDHAGLVAQLETLTGEHPLRERLFAQQMLALYRSGRQGEALRVYDRLRETLADELGIDPSAELRQLHQRILNQDPELDPPRPPPSGALAFLFTDIEDSTPLWEAEPTAMTEAVAAQDRVISAAVEAAAGRVVARTGDAIDAIFPDVASAANAAIAAQRELAATDWGSVGSLAVRMAIDAGEVELSGECYQGSVLNRLGRILAAGHGGQVLLSGDAAEALSGTGTSSADDHADTRPLGEYRFKGVGRPQEVHQLLADGLATDFPPLRLDRTPVAAGEPVVSVRGYELRDVLGEGDFGFVYRAYQPSVAREVAVKVIRPEYANQPAFIRRFEAEARFIAQLEHPHIVGLHDFWREPKGAYLVMPLLRGGSLAEALQRGPWNLGPALRLLDQVGAALSYAHRSGIVHRDLKPGNVLLDEDGNAYLSDFGIASRLTDAADDVVTSSLPYVPPEELRGEELTPRSDIFSLGVLTFALLTGVNPTGGALPALAEARPDLPGELSDVLATATDDQPSERYERVEDLLRALRRAVGADVVGTAAPERSPGLRAPVRSPYKGLRAFQDTDAGDFYGRETLVDELLQAVSDHRLVGVVGASGSGKSSVVRAGLVPALRAGRLPGSRGWLVADMFPGSYPFEELESALLRVAVENPGGLLGELRSDEHGLLRVVKRILPPDDSELVLVIDQFEELFSLVDDEATRRLFLGSLESLTRDARGRVRVVITLRADFFDQPLDYPGFGDLLKAGIVAVTPPSEESLGLAISRPARSVGMELEPGLVGEIIADVLDEPGGLPLLQYALTELFRRREDGQLTIAGYRATGGVVGALGRRAEELYQGLAPEAREVAHQLFLRLVTVDEEVDDTRRRVSQSELDGLDVDPEHLETVLQQYASYRLLTFDRDATTRIPTVEVAHEALLREWARLRGWIEEQRADLILHRRLQGAVRDWSEADEDPSYLLRGGRLEQAERWAAGSGIALSRQEDDYLTASRRMADTEEAAARRRRRRVVAGLATALVVVAALAVVAVFQWRTAAQETRIADARALAASALAQLEDDPELSILLALAAVDTTYEIDGTVIREAEEALHRSVKRSRLVHTVPHGPGLAVAADGRRFATSGEDGTARVWSSETGEPVLTLAGHEGQVVNVDLGPGGDVIATTGVDGTVRLWDGRTGEPQQVLTGHEGWVGSPTFSAEGRRLATSGQDGTIRIWDVVTGTEEMVLVGHEAETVSPSFSPDGTRLVSASGDWSVRVWDLASAEVLFELSGYELNINRVVYSPDGTRIATAGNDAVPRVWDAETGEELRAFHGHTSITTSVSFSPDGERLATGGVDATVRIWDVGTGQQMITLAGHTADIEDVYFTPDGEMLISASLDGTTRVWDVGVGGSRTWATVGAPWRRFAGVVFSPDGSTFAVPQQVSGVTIHDTATGAVVRQLGGHGTMAVRMAYSPDGSLLAAVAGSGFTWDDPASYEVAVWDVTTGELVATLAGHDGELGAVAFSPGGDLLASGGRDGVAKVWETRMWSEVTTLATADRPYPLVLAASFSPDGGLLAVSGDDGIAVFDTGTWDQVDTPWLDTGEGWVWDLHLTADGRLVGTGEGTVRIWDLDAGELVGTIRPGGLINLTAVDETGERIATTSQDGTVRLWDASSGRLLLTIHAHDVLAWDADFSPDGRLLATVSPDGTVAIHLLPIDELRELAHDRLTRGLTNEECAQYLHVDTCPEDL